MHMYVIANLLIPGMEDLDDFGCCTEPLWIGRKFKKCLGTASVQKCIEKLLVTVNQGVEFMWKRKYHMKVRGVNHFCSAFVHPDLPVGGLAAWTAAISAGVVVEIQMATVRALGKVSPQITGLTVKDGPGSFSLNIRQMVGFFCEGLVRSVPDLLDFQISHGTLVKGADCIARTIRSKMNINRSRIQRFMPKQSFDGEQVGTVFVKVGAKRMTERASR